VKYVADRLAHAAAPIAPVAWFTAALVAPSAQAGAPGLRVEPVLLNLEAPAAASFVTLHNSDDKDMAVQTRVFRWSERDNTEDLQPATDVAVSPPIATIGPGEDYMVRVVRVAETPVRGEESYRLWIDELPDARRRGPSGLNILIRQSIPVFFHAQDMAAPNLTWSARREDGKILLVAQNSGDEHVRIIALQLHDSAGKTVSFGAGLIGYVLGHASLTFTAKHPPPGFGADGTIAIDAQGNTGNIHATTQLHAEP
jgi:fimbrial chaperone protein